MPQSTYSTAHRKGPWNGGHWYIVTAVAVSCRKALLHFLHNHRFFSVSEQPKE